MEPNLRYGHFDGKFGEITVKRNPLQRLSHKNVNGQYILIWTPIKSFCPRNVVNICVCSGQTVETIRIDFEVYAPIDE